MKIIIYILFFCFTGLVEAQNITEKTFPATTVTSININGENIFQITVETKPVDAITIYSRVEGENNQDFILVTETKNNNLHVSVKQQPLFKDANDKLSAHKVISVAIRLVIPENLKVLANIYNSDFIVKGRYRNVVVNSNYGNCFLNTFLGNAKIYTRNGNIALQTKDANIVATSKNGLIKTEEINTGFHQIEIKTINGNVSITKSQ
ncbi:hypothetical protein Q4512_01925 [Oceanihabitans sp. 2_MG-2023]|uniref:hypothetical protein n=1 Tax=Oceanihabitans sp. 2_MG-2023 TaxID=3062661 RepID=UPI0026E3FFF2|nr:hypothetical protein [Oceanihabitans sp. 2_MG-2023]MDO6595652.1 hypothetical protein [Oceanihabitans sp. 2_MG-2023]